MSLISRMWHWKCWGRGCRVSLRADIRGWQNIVLGSAVRVDAYAVLDAASYGVGRLLVGNRTEIHRYAILACYGGEITIGEDCSVNPFCVLYGHGGLHIGKQVRIAAHTVIIPANHSFDDVHRPIMCQTETRLGISIGDDVWIGTGARILDGVRIGRGAVIGAGAVVSRDVPEFAVAVGVPARVIRDRRTGPLNTPADESTKK